MGGRKVRSLKARVGRECCISCGGQIVRVEQWRYTNWRAPKTKTRCSKLWNLKKKQRRSKENSYGVRGAEIFESRKGE